MNKEELKKIDKLLEKAHEQIDKSLDNRTFESIEWGVVKGLESLLEAERFIKQKIETA